MRTPLRHGRWLLATGVLALGLGLGAGAQNGDLSGDAILERAAEEGGFNVEGSQISRTRFELVFEDGTTGTREFAFFSKDEPDAPDKTLIYFLRPELECGTSFLTVSPEASGEEDRLWLFLPGLGQVKELVSEEDRNASFAGSNLERDEIGGGGQDLAEDYRGTREAVESVEVAWRGEPTEREAFRVSLTQREGADVDFPTGRVWIDTEEFTTLRSEFDNANGTRERILTLDQFVEFAGDIVPNEIVVENVLNGSETTVTTEERRRPDEPLPDAIFTPDNLSSFNPEEFGIDSPCVE